MNQLLNKNILITGASDGLGRELAMAFAREGASALSLVARRGAWRRACAACLGADGLKARRAPTDPLRSLSRVALHGIPPALGPLPGGRGHGLRPRARRRPHPAGHGLRLRHGVGPGYRAGGPQSGGRGEWTLMDSPTPS